MRDPQNLTEHDMNFDVLCRFSGCEFEGEADGTLIAYGMDWHSFEWVCPGCGNTNTDDKDNDGCYD